MTQRKNTKLPCVGFKSTTLVHGAFDRSATMELCRIITVVVSTWTQNGMQIVNMTQSKTRNRIRIHHIGAWCLRPHGHYGTL